MAELKLSSSDTVLLTPAGTASPVGWQVIVSGSTDWVGSIVLKQNTAPPGSTRTLVSVALQNPNTGEEIAAGTAITASGARIVSPTGGDLYVVYTHTSGTVNVRANPATQGVTDNELETAFLAAGFETSGQDTPVTQLSAAVAMLLGQSLDVKAFGAVGDGVTDDGPAIDAAIAACSAAGGGDVLLPLGTYRRTTAQALKSKVNLVGAGWATHIVQATTSESVLNAASADAVVDVVIRDVRLSGSGTGGTGPAVVRLDTVSRVTLLRVWADEGPLNGIQVLDSAFVRVTDCHISDWYGATHSGVNLLRCTDSVVSGCELHGGPWIGVNLDDCTECRVLNNTIYDNGHSGVNVYKASARCIVAHNTIRDLTGGSGIVVDGETSWTCTDTLVHGNMIDTVPTQGISVRFADRTQVVGNHVRAAAAASGAGILVFETAVDTLVQGNVSEANTAHGIFVKSDASRATVTGNLCRNNGIRGIWVNTHFCTIGNNTCYLNGQTGLFVQAEMCTVTGNHFRDNGQTTDNTYDGINIAGGRNVVSGNWSGNTAAGGSQRYGINISGGTNNAVTGNVAFRNETGNLNDAGTTTSLSNNVVT